MYNASFFKCGLWPGEWMGGSWGGWWGWGWGNSKGDVQYTINNIVSVNYTYRQCAIVLVFPWLQSVLFSVTSYVLSYYCTVCYTPSYLQYKAHFSRQKDCWSLRCSWSSACRHCSNYIFIFDLTSGFNWLARDKWKTRRETFKFGDMCGLDKGFHNSNVQYCLPSVTANAVSISTNSSWVTVRVFQRNECYKPWFKRAGVGFMRQIASIITKSFAWRRYKLEHVSTNEITKKSYYWLSVQFYFIIPNKALDTNHVMGRITVDSEHQHKIYIDTTPRKV